MPEYAGTGNSKSAENDDSITKMENLNYRIISGQMPEYAGTGNYPEIIH